MKTLSRILIIDNSPALTGALKSIVAVTAELKHRFAFLYCIPRKGTSSQYLSATGFRFVNLPFLELRRNLSSLFYFFFLFSNAWRIARIVRNEQIQIVHVNDFYNMTGVAVKLLVPHIRLVYHVRLLKTSYQTGLYDTRLRLINKYADHVIACSQAVRRQLPTDPQQTTVVYDAMQAAEKHPPREPGANTSNIRLLYLSHYIPGKGHDDALAAFTIAYKKNRDIRITFAGGDLGLRKNMDYKKQLMIRADESGLGDVVEFLDFQPDTEQLIKSAEICLNFSASESFSMTCLEALHFGTPLIATDSGGPSELFEHNKSGLLVPVHDIQAMAQAILLLAENPGLRTEFSQASKEFVRRKFSLTSSAGILGDIYHKLLGN